MQHMGISKKKANINAGRNIAAKRAFLGFKNQDEFAAHLGLHQNTIKRIESGASGGWPKTRALVLEAIGCTEDEIMLDPDVFLLQQGIKKLPKVKDLFKEDKAQFMRDLDRGLAAVTALLSRLAQYSPEDRRDLIAVIFDDPSLASDPDVLEGLEFLSKEK